MSALDLHERRDVPSREEPNWIKLNAEHGGKLEQRVHALLEEHSELSRIDAQIVALAQERWGAGKIAELLGIEEQTVYNHVSKMRKKAGIARDVRFRMLYLPRATDSSKGDEFRA